MDATAMSAEFFDFHEADLDGAKAAVEQNFFTASMDLLDRTATYDFRFAGVVFGALSVGVAHVNAGIEVGMPDLESSYYINYSAGGAMRARHRRTTVEVGPGGGALYNPVGDTHMTTSDDYGSYAVRVDCSALRDALQAELGHSVPDEPELGTALNLADGAGARWDRLIRLICDEASDPAGVLTHPGIAAPLHDAVVTGLMYAADHPWRTVLDRPVRCWSRVPVGRAVDVIHADPAHSHTPAELARSVGTNIRTLHDGFRRHLGTTPMRYLRGVRLERAHHDLRRSDPRHGDTVSAVAYRWGFNHQSRFGAAYRARYGRGPADTLRR